MVSVRNLTRAFDGRKVLDDISFEVQQAEIMAIMGSSGGGKTTLLRCISGLLEPTSGQVLVDGIDVQKQPEEARRHMGMVFQSAALFDYLNVWDNVLFGLTRWSKETPKQQAERAKNVLQLVGLADAEKLMPAELSGGMRKRVGLARALVLEPKVMLYDEPTTGLDPVTTYTIDKLMVDVRDQLKVTSLIVSHDVSAVFRVADRVAFLDAGRLLYDGDVDGFRKSKESAILEVVSKSQATHFLE